MWCRNSRKVRYLLILKMWSTQVIDESSSTKLCVSIRQVLSRRRKREGGRRVNTRSFMYSETTDMPRLKWPSITQESTLYDVAMQWARHSTDGFLSAVQICLGCALDCTAGCISRWPASSTTNCYPISDSTLYDLWLITHDRVVFVIYLGPICINKAIPSEYKQIGVENELICLWSLPMHMDWRELFYFQTRP